ncbi:MAG: oxygen-independent coproporphyrinogen III oxidase, partial [Candidatus Omnitrophica bacterium]|nr:oxygen-independent coproporphyrinogen III oxidase [Candidatus Omnitrophota bacterium]
VTTNKLALLRKLGFNRVSMGVQDFDNQVMEVVNRQQPYDMVKTVTEECRGLGFRSVNFDLIYGLPKQTQQTFRQTMQHVLELRPDRIALYNFAYVPWLQKHQTKLEEQDFPGNDAKLDIFLLAREQLLSNGYQAIAMDHFALATDEMARAFHDGKLYRNFMGYTVKPADEYIGLGVSAISFLENTFIQNVKILGDYYRYLADAELPVERGKILSDDDIIRRWVILELMCHFQINKTYFYKKFQQSFEGYFEFEQPHISKCVADGLIEHDADCLVVTELGRLFIRNICMGFDIYLRKNTQQKRFSRTV